MRSRWRSSGTRQEIFLLAVDFVAASTLLHDPSIQFRNALLGLGRHPLFAKLQLSRSLTQPPGQLGFRESFLEQLADPLPGRLRRNHHPRMAQRAVDRQDPALGTDPDELPLPGSNLLDQDPAHTTGILNRARPDAGFGQGQDVTLCGFGRNLNSLRTLTLRGDALVYIPGVGRAAEHTPAAGEIPPALTVWRGDAARDDEADRCHHAASGSHTRSTDST